jgi:iron complex transport system substrate-binding protein
MKKTYQMLVVLFLLSGLLLNACKVSQDVVGVATEEPQIYPIVQEPTAQEATEELSPHEVQVEYAQGFTIEYFETYKVLTVLQPWLGASETFSYILVPKGGSAPEETNGALVVNVPIESIVTMSTTYFPFLESLGKLDTLVGVDDVTYAYNETVRAMAENGELVITGGGAGGGTANVEALIELSPDVIMTSASGTPELDAHPKLIEAGLPVVLNGDYLENSPLGRAEWGKFIAAFYNQEAEAETQFNEMVSRYNALVELTANVPEKPSVFTNTDFQGSWYVPAGQSYAAILLQDAGANYLWADEAGTGSIPFSFEAVVEKASEADYWLNVGFPSDLDSLLTMDERYQGFKAFETGQVYNYNKRVTDNGGMDYYESGVANPDKILADLVAIFHPELMPEHDFYYYTQLK